VALSVDQSSPAFLVRGATQVRDLSVLDGLTAKTVADGGTYTLYDRDGNEVDSGTTSDGSVAVEVPADATFGGGAWEVWDVTVGGEARRYRFPAYLVDTDLRDTPVTQPQLSGVFGARMTGTVSYQTVILLSWRGLLSDLARDGRLQGSAEVWSPVVLWKCAFRRTVAALYRYFGSSGQPDLVALAVQWEQFAAEEYERLRVRYDTDGDGDADTTAERLGSADNTFAASPL